MLGREIIKEILSDQREVLLRKDFGVEREALNLVHMKLSLPHVIVITGIRRSGKSTLLRQIVHKFYNDTDFYYINFEDERFLDFLAQNFNKISEVLLELYGEKTTFLIDEIQNVDRFESFVRRLHDEGFKVIITGSNTNLLSKELGTKLTGRHVDIIVNPFSFKEFLSYHKMELHEQDIYKTNIRVKIKKYFDIYLIEGGMPEYVIFKDSEILARIYDDLLTKDIIVRYHLDNVREIRELYQYMISNFAQKFSYNSLKNSLKIKSVTTINKYLTILQETFFSFIISKYKFSYKVSIRSKKKQYLLDNGFISVLSVKLTKDKGWLLENLVFNELKKRGDVFYYSNDFECDFLVISKNEIIQVVQVCWELTKTDKAREITGLLKAMNKFQLREALILTYDQEDQMQIKNNTITILPVWKWLLS